MQGLFVYWLLERILEDARGLREEEERGLKEDVINAIGAIDTIDTIAVIDIIDAIQGYYTDDSLSR